MNGLYAIPAVIGALPASFTEWPTAIKVSIFAVGLVVTLYFVARSNASVYLSPVDEHTTNGSDES